MKRFRSTGRTPTGPIPLRKRLLRHSVSTFSALALSTLLVFPGCSGDDTTPTPTPSPTPVGTPATDGFSSAIGGSNSGGMEPPTDGETDEGAEPQPDDGEREVEEADILIQKGNTLYILNMYRGLMVVDVTNPDKPRARGRVPLTGYPVEMYVSDDGRAYIVVSDYYYYWRVAEDDSVDSFHGSMLAIVDVSNSDSPALLGKIDLEGYVSQTRRVGDVIYAVSNRYAYYSCDGGTDDTEDMTYVVSVDISVASNPHVVDTLAWPGVSAQVHATPHSFYVIEPEYNYTDGETTEPGEEVPPSDGSSSGGSDGSSGGSADSSGDPEGTDPTPTAKPSEDPAETPVPPDGTPSTDPTSKPEETRPPDEPTDPPTTNYSTHITYIDISDPNGVMDERGSISVPGITYDKFALNEFENTFRISTQKWDGYSSGTVTILDVTNPDEISQLSTLDIVLPQLESITATRFDGARGYLVTAERTDPLFILDLADPSAPRVAGEVEMPGQLNHLEILGDRLVAFGQDNSEENTWKFAVSLFDVADMDNPLMLDREIIGGGTYSWSSATWDDKSFTILEDEGLIAVPFTAYNEDWTSTGGVQFLDYTPQDLTVRGMVTHQGYVTRVRPVGERLLSLSDANMLMIDATNRDKPVVTADVSLAQYVSDYLPMGDIGIQLITPSYYWYSNSMPMGALRIVDASNPDEMDADLGSIEISLYDGQLVRLSDSRVAVVRNTYDSSYNTLTSMDVYDVRSEGAPILTSTLKLPSPVYSWASNYSYYYGSTGGALVQTDNALAYLASNYYYGGYPETDEGPKVSKSAPAPAANGKTTTADPLSRLYVIDVSNPDAPSVSELSFEDSLFNLKAYGDTLYATHAETFTSELNGVYYNYARYYLDSIDVSTPTAPALTASVNVPGVFQHLLDDGKTYVTLDSAYATTDTEYGVVTYMEYSLKGVEIKNGRASVLGTIPLEGSSYSMLYDGDVAYMVKQNYYWMYSDVVYNGCYYSMPVTLESIKLAFDGSDPVMHEQELPTYYGYLRAVHRPASQDSGYLFVDAGSEGLMMYSLGSDPLKPTFMGSERTSGYALHVRPEGDSVYLPLGMYGVQTISLESGEAARSVAVR